MKASKYTAYDKNNLMKNIIIKKLIQIKGVNLLIIYYSKILGHDNSCDCFFFLFFLYRVCGLGDTN